MAPAPLANRRMLLLVVALVCSTLACTLSWLEEEDTGSPVAPDGQTGLPTVRIVSPASGQRVPVNQAVEVTVETNEAATGLTLSVDGRSGTSIGISIVGYLFRLGCIASHTTWSQTGTATIADGRSSPSTRLR